MAVWTVWEKPRLGAAAALKARFVRDSFSWLAFLFPPLWLVANRMIVTLVLLAALIGAAVWGATEYGVAPEIVAAAAPVLMLWFGFEARALKRRALAAHGWVMTGVVEATRFRTAERRYFADRLAPAGMSVAAAGPSVPPTGGAPRDSSMPPPLPAVPPRAKPRRSRFFR